MVVEFEEPLSKTINATKTVSEGRHTKIKLKGYDFYNKVLGSPKFVASLKILKYLSKKTN